MKRSSAYTACDILLPLLALAFFLGLLFVFGPCGTKEDGGWMTCHWAGQALRGLAGVLLVIALLHLLPGRAEESLKILDWIAENLPGAWVSLMAQYLPMGRVEGVDELERRLTPEEYERVVAHLMELGLEDGFVQELSSSDEKYIPAFDLTGV